MERKTFLKAGLSVAAALPGLGPSIPRALAGEALKATTITWWNWNNDPPINPYLTSAPGVSHNSRNDAVKSFYQKSHPGTVIDVTGYPYPNYVTALKTAFAGGNEPDAVALQPGALLAEYQRRGQAVGTAVAQPILPLGHPRGAERRSSASDDVRVAHWLVRGRRALLQ